MFTVYVKDLQKFIKGLEGRFCGQLKNQVDATWQHVPSEGQCKTSILRIVAHASMQELFAGLTNEDRLHISNQLFSFETSGEDTSELQLSSGEIENVKKVNDSSTLNREDTLSEDANSLASSFSEMSTDEDSLDSTVIEASQKTSDLILFSQESLPEENVSLTSLFPGFMMLSITVVHMSAKVTVQGPFFAMVSRVRTPQDHGIKACTEKYAKEGNQV